MTATVLPAGVKPTTGAKFDRDAGLLYFIAGSAGVLLDRLCDERNVMLDSGIFSLANEHAHKHGVSHDAGLSMPPEEIDGFEALWERYGEVSQRYADRLWGAVELDQGGVEHKPRIRARIETEFGITPMPVYHPLLDGWAYFDQLAEGYDRLCFGNIVKASPPLRLRLSFTASERAREYPYLWQHFLGMTPNENLLGIPYRGSCDSSSWVTSLRWFPSWRGWSALRMVTDYPTTMWYGPGDIARGYALCGLTADAAQRTIEAMREDTHPWL